MTFVCKALSITPIATVSQMKLKCSEFLKTVSLGLSGHND